MYFLAEVPRSEDRVVRESVEVRVRASLSC